MLKEQWVKHILKREESRDWDLSSFGLNVIMRASTLGMFSPPQFLSFFFRAEILISTRSLNSKLPYIAFLRPCSCCLISNGKGVFMNVHKHVSCQVSVFCLLSKATHVLINFPSAGATICISSKVSIGSTAWKSSRREKWLQYWAMLRCIFYVKSS